jgi:hypothetical protein
MSHVLHWSPPRRKKKKKKEEEEEDLCIPKALEDTLSLYGSGRQGEEIVVEVADGKYMN